MKHPIYPFSTVLRALRKESQLKPEDAAVRTTYPNYKRWESSKTPVRPEYLPLIAEAFDVGDDLWLLLYAWLVDRLVPRRGQPAVQVETQLRELTATLPGGVADLGTVGPFVGPPLTHAELAAGCIVARYGPGPSAPDEPIVVQAVERSRVPSSAPSDTGVLGALYGDVLGEWMQFTALGGMLAGVGQAGEERRDAVLRDAMGAMLAPGGLDQVAALFSTLTITGDEHGLDRMPGVAAAELPAFPAILSQGIDELARFQQAAARVPMTQMEFLLTVMQLAQAGPEALLAEDCPIDITKVPDLDPTTTADARAMFDRVDRAFRQSVDEELTNAVATANPAAAVEVIARVRRDQP
jgi:hypothetical protein